MGLLLRVLRGNTRSKKVSEMISDGERALVVVDADDNLKG